MRQKWILCLILFLCVGLTLLWGQKKPAHESPRPQGAVKVGMEEQHKAQVARVFDELFTNGRYEAVGQIYHPDCTVHTNNKNYRLNEAVNEGKGTVARQKLVKIGDMAGNNVEVLDGIKPGDHLIVSGAQFLQDGAPVAEHEAAAAGPPTAKDAAAPTR